MIGGSPVSVYPGQFAGQPQFIPPGGFASAPPGFPPGAATFAGPPPGFVSAPQTLPAVFPGAPAPPFLARAKVDDPPLPRPSTLILPPPDNVGVARRPTPADDLADAHRRLQELGVVWLHLEPLPTGGFSFTFLLPTGEVNRAYRIEAHGATQGEAMRAALDRAAPLVAHGPH